MLSEITILRAVGRGHKIEVELDPMNYLIELMLDGQRWVRTSPLGSPFKTPKGRA